MTELFAAPAAPAGRAQLTNMRLALQTLAAAQEAGPDSSTRFCVLYGHSGYGKSVAAAYVAARTNAAYVEAKSIWTQRSILEAIGTEIGLVRLERTGPRLLQQIIDQLNVEPMPLIIDEMDHLVKKQTVEILRDIHDGTTVPILMIGEEALPAKLKAWERFDNRIIAVTPAQPATAEDVRKLRDHYCTRVALADDLADAIATGSKGVTRRIVVNLRQVQSRALDAGRASADLGWWKTLGEAFLTGELPARRKAS